MLSFYTAEEVDALLAAKKLGLILPVQYQLFGPVQGGPTQGGGALCANPPASWASPGQALSGTVASIYYSLGKVAPVKFARWLNVWSGDSTSISLRLCHADSGPVNITQIASIAANGNGAPTAQEVVITDAMNGLAAGGVNKHLMIQWKATAGQCVLWESVIEAYYEV